jgi:hypothetical protein
MNIETITKRQAEATRQASTKKPPSLSAQLLLFLLSPLLVINQPSKQKQLELAYRSVAERQFGEDNAAM